MNVPSRFSTAFSRVTKPRLMQFDDDQILYEEGSEPHCWYEVEEGVVRTCRFFPDGDRQVVGFFYPGDCFGIDFGVREENAEAVTSAKVWRHHHGDLASAGDVQIALEAALHTTRSWLYLLGRRTAEQRVAAFLLSLSDRLSQDGLVSVPMSRTDIADHLRLTVHTISRTITRLAGRDLIRFKTPQSFWVVDTAGLRAVARREQAAI